MQDVKNSIIRDTVIEINNNLDIYLKEFVGKNIYEPMEYSLKAGGKRFRPLLIILMYNSIKCLKQGESYKQECYKQEMPFAVAIEFIHTYSLIHDDLPCMDNDDFRRGLPTCHKKFDEATAVLAGDALLNTAFEIMLDSIKNNKSFKYIEASSIIIKASGSKGMIDGQVIDMKSERCERLNKDNNKDNNNKDVIADTNQKILLDMYKNKTGQLISASLKVGAVLAEAEKNIIDIIKQIGYDLGLAFQIKDDILDLTGKQDVIGKPVKSDIKNQKMTYVELYGLEKAKQDYDNLYKKILLDLENINLKESIVYYYIKSCFDREF